MKRDKIHAFVYLHAKDESSISRITCQMVKKQMKLSQVLLFFLAVAIFLFLLFLGSGCALDVMC